MTRLYLADKPIPGIESDYVFTDKSHNVLAPRALHFIDGRISSQVYKSHVLVRAEPGGGSVLIQNAVVPTEQPAFNIGDNVYGAFPGEPDQCRAMFRTSIANVPHSVLTHVEEGDHLELLLRELQKQDQSDSGYITGYQTESKSRLEREKIKYEEGVARVQTRLQDQVQSLNRDRLSTLQEIGERIRLRRK